jgi:holo-[acyl-carrier protein] synthase
MFISIGLDAAEVPRVASMIARWGDRFLARVFTPAERAYCDAHRRREVHYAGRFAAKEAATKALGTGISLGVRWRDVEVVRAAGGPPEVRLHGEAARRARALGAGRALVSITHTGTVALAAVVLAAGGPVETSADPSKGRPGTPARRRRARLRRPAGLWRSPHRL